LILAPNNSLSLGIHHSWETDDQLPNGNIVYEVQLDVKDDYCTLRSFDQGKFKDNGEIRTITIDDYFKALNTDPSANNPEKFLRPTSVTRDGSTEIQYLFSTPDYHLTSINFSDTYKGKEANTELDGFHHLFVKEGSVVIETNSASFPVEKGWSLFIPASTGKYQITSTKPAIVLKTTV
jgi:mannose-6-phosphate isomerase class I